MIRVFLLVVVFFPSVCFSQIDDSTKPMVKLNGALNFSDICGYETTGGKHVKWGKIYRSAEINNLTNSDLDSLQKRHINYVFDFRAEVAIAQAKPPLGATRFSLTAGSEGVGDRAKMIALSSKASNGDSIMMLFYTNTQSFPVRYIPLFTTLLNNNIDSAVLFHCIAGKDRTGIGAALILYALGVDEKIIMQVYLASNYYRKPATAQSKKMFVANYHIKEGVAEDIMSVQEKYLMATFETIRAKYGSIYNYLKKEMGLSKQKLRKLRALYLQQKGYARQQIKSKIKLYAKEKFSAQFRHYDTGC